MDIEGSGRIGTDRNVGSDELVEGLAEMDNLVEQTDGQSK